MRLLGPDPGSGYVFLPSGAPAVLKTVRVYVDLLGTPADIAEYQPDAAATPGPSIPGGITSTNLYGQMLFWFPDDAGLQAEHARVLYVSVNDGPLTRVTADHQSQVELLRTAVADLASGAANADAIAAEASARAAAVTAEAEARAAGDDALADSIGQESGARAAAIDQEATSRSAADASEATARAAGDAASTDALAAHTVAADPHDDRAYSVDRQHHTGTQPADTITGLGDAATRNVGATAGTVAAGDAAPTAHATSHGPTGSDPVTVDLAHVSGAADALAAKADLVDGKIVQAQVPSTAVVDYLGAVSSQAAMLALVGDKGDFCTRTDLSTDWRIVGNDPTQLSSWLEFTYPGSPVTSVFGRTGAVTGSPADVGLGNVNNTSDANKPISTAQQTAIDAKQPLDADLTTIAGLDSATAGALATDGAGWIRKTYAQLKTALGLVKADVGLGNVDNTSDANKPVSTAQANADAAKVDKGSLLVNVKDHGAVGDGTTDDTTAITAAQTAAVAAGHAIVFLPPGTYKHTGFSVTASFRGTGRGRSTLYGPQITMSTSNTFLEDLKVQSTSSTAIISANCSDLRLQRIEVDHDAGVTNHLAHDPFNVIRWQVLDCKFNIGGLQPSGCQDFLVQGNYWDCQYLNTNEACHISGGSSGVFNANTVKNVATDAVDLFSSGHYCVISNNRFIGLRGASGLECKVTMSDDPNNTSSPGNVIDATIITGNVFRDFNSTTTSTRNGIFAAYVDSRATPAFSVAETNRAFHITGNVLEDFNATDPGNGAIVNYQGIAFVGHNGVISNNIIRNVRAWNSAQAEGISLAGATAGVSANNQCAGLAVRGNTLAGVEGGFGIRAGNLNNCSINDNIVRGDEVNATNTKFGIECVPGATWTNVTMNNNTLQCSGYSTGMGLRSGAGSTITRSTVSGNIIKNCGVALTAVQYTTFVGNTMDNAANHQTFAVGVSGTSSRGNTFTGQHITMGTDYGLVLTDHDGFAVSGCTFNNTNRAVLLIGNTRHGAINNNISVTQSGSSTALVNFSGVSAADTATVNIGSANYVLNGSTLVSASVPAIRLTTTVTKTAAYTAVTGDLVRADVTAGSFAITLPTGAAVGETVAVKLLGTPGANVLTVQRGGTDLIDGGTAAVTMTMSGESAVFVANGSGTWTLAGGQKPVAALDARYVKQRDVNVKDYGALGDGTTDDSTAIRNALAAAVVAGQSGIVYFPQGTYIVRPNTANKVCLLLPAGLKGIRGADRTNTIIKVADSVSDYYAVLSNLGLALPGPAVTATDVSGLLVSDIQIDQNTRANAVTDTTSSGAFMTTYPRFVVNLNGMNSGMCQVRDSKFTDMDNVNTIVFAGRDVTVDRCEFSYGTSSGSHDHSTIYTQIKVANGQSNITDNLFYSPAAGTFGATTAIETHGGSQYVAGNTVRNYQIGANITGQSLFASDGIHFVDNTILDSRYGVQLWSGTYQTNTGPEALRSTHIRGNTIRLDPLNQLPVGQANSTGIFIDPNANLPFHNVYIENNDITFKGGYTGRAGDTSSMGVDWRRVASPTTGNDRNVFIRNNTVDSPLAGGIRVLNLAGDVGHNFVITDNLIRNPGQGTTTAGGALNAGLALGLYIAATLKNSTISGNRVIDDQGTPTTRSGVYLYPPDGNGANNVVAGNRCPVSTAKKVDFSPTTYGGWLLRMDVETYTAATGIAAVGSEIRDVSTGVVYRQTTAPYGTSWLLTTGAYTPELYGAVGDGTVDDEVAVRAAFTAANALARTGLTSTIKHPGATVVLRGTYNLPNLAAPIDIMCDVRSEGAAFTIPAAYAGIAVRVGHTTSGSWFQDADITLPDVVKPSSTTTPVAGSVGVQVINLGSSVVRFGRVAYFETGHQYTGLGQGTVYNTFHPGWVSYCKVGMSLKPLTGGWVNQNVWVAGGVQQSPSWPTGIGVRASGYRHLVLDGAGINPVNGNTFVGTSFEGNVSEYAFYVHSAYQNLWFGCRHEAGTAYAAATVSGSAITSTAHGLSVGDVVLFTASVAPTGMVLLTPYYVVAVADANTFSVSRNKAGTAITFTSSGTSVVWAVPHRIYYDTSGTGVSENVIRNPVNPLGWLDVIHSSGIASGNTLETSSYAERNLYAPEDLPMYRARNANSGATLRPLFATYSSSNDPIEKPDAWSTALSDRGLIWQDGTIILKGTGSPEGVVTAPVSSVYLRSDGATGTTLYTKESGTGNTGWATKSSPAPRVSTTASSATPTPNATTDDMYTVTALAVGATIGAPTGTPANGQGLVIRIKDNGTSQTLAWNATYRGIGLTLPGATVAGKILYVGAKYNSQDSVWDVLATGQQ